MIKVAEEISQSQVWPVLDSLRSELPTRDMPVALAVLIYLRWADFQEAELEAIAAFDEADYEPVLPTGLHWRTWHVLPPQQLQRFFGKQLSPALERLNNSRHNKLATHLHHIAPAVKQLETLSPRSLHALLHWLAEQPFETPTDRRAMLDVFDAVFEKTRDKYAGEFRTPGAVARLMVELAAPIEGERVYDPCFGSAGLLTAACHYALRTGKDRFSRSGAPPISISGVELNRDAYVIGLTRLALAGVDDPQLELGNSLERTGSNNPQRDGFDVVLTNPPWGMRADPTGLDHFPVKTTDATGLFIQHALSQLRPEGRAVIVVPQGFLFRGGPEQRLRRHLLEQHRVEAIIALPEKTFLPYTSIRASLLVLRRTGPTKRIRMADTTPLFKKGKGKQPAALHEDKARAFGRNLWSPKADNYCWDVDAESLAEFEWDFTPRRRDQSGLIGVMDALRSKTIVSPLRSCCSIDGGQTIKREHLLSTLPGYGKAPEQPTLFPEKKQTLSQTSMFGNSAIPFPEEKQTLRQTSMFDNSAIPYVRIKDVQHGQVTKGSRWLSQEATAYVNPETKLRAGDVLVSKSGTIGKAGIVRNGAVGAIAASGFFILRPIQESLDPHFLMAYLNSNECRTWLGERARGTSIQRLSKSVLYELPVPLPPLQIQHRVANEHRERGVDMLSFLAQLLTQGERDPISEWVEKKLKSFPDSAEKLADIMDLTPLDHLAIEGKSLFQEAYNRIDGGFPETTLESWIMIFYKAISPLQGVHDMPLGAGLLSVLQESIHGLQQAANTLGTDLPKEVKARKLSNTIKEWVSEVCVKMLSETKLILSTESAALYVGENVELVLKVKNASHLPLREIYVFTEPDWGDIECSYLAEDSSAEFNLSGFVPNKTGTFAIKALWQARTLDDQYVHGSREISFEVLPLKSKGQGGFAELGASPYVCGPEIRPDRDDIFFGREELIGQIRRQVIRSGNVILLEGNRRSGKSSILRHLEGIDPIPGWLGVFCSFQGSSGSEKLAGVSTVEIFRNIATNIAKGLVCIGNETPLPNGKVLPVGQKLGIRAACRGGISDSSPFDDFLDYIEVVLDVTENSNLGILMMLDEFDKLQEGIDNGVTSPQVPENIRFLVMNYPRLSAILTGSRRLKRLREEYWSALFGLGTRFGVTSLPLEAAKKLVTEPVKGRLTYSREAVERCMLLTNCQPFLLQSLCNRIFDMAAQLKNHSVTLDFVEQGADLLSEDNSHFSDLWSYARSDRRRFVLGLIHKETTGPDPLRFGVLLELLSNNGIEVSDETLISDLEFLRELELIELEGKAGSGHYTLSIPLMGRWIDRQHDFVVLQKRAQMETEEHDV